MADTRRPMCGDNLPLYYAKIERHHAEARTFFLGEAHQETHAQGADLYRELREALTDAQALHPRRVKALRIDMEPS